MLTCADFYVKIVLVMEMVYTYKEILEKYGSRYELEKALKNNEILKLEKGIYSDTDLVNPIIIISKKYPKGIITMDSAFYYYDLTDVIPQNVYLATNRKSKKVKDNRVVQIYMDKDILNYGKTEIIIKGNKVNMYDKERLLIELIRKRASIPFDYYKEIISNYRYISDKLDMYKIEEYVGLFKNEVNLFDILQREVF